MKIKSTIQIHPLLLCLLLAGYFLGLFVEIITLFALIIIHELGHLAAARHYGWKIKRLIIWPFGGVMETEDFYNRPTKEELWVTIAGPLQHVWIYGFIYFLQTTAIPEFYIDQLFWMNSLLLLFNILPILPLDGGRFLFLIISHWMPFHRSLIMITIFSMFVIVLVNGILFMNGWFSPQFIILSVILLFDNWFTYYHKQLYLMKHMLARLIHTQIERTHTQYLYFPVQTKLNEMMKQFKKNHYHLIQIDERALLTEDDYLNLLFSRQARYDLLEEK